MVKFGPSGNSASFYAEGNSSTLQAPRWIRARGLDLFEYSFGKGVNMSEATAAAIGREAAENGIEISVHAPYYVNFANPDEDKAKNGHEHLLRSLRAVRLMGGSRVVFHSGTETGLPRKVAFANIKRRLAAFSEMKRAEGFSDLFVCPETMGKIAQIGDEDEIAELCSLDDTFLPCVDFGHLNARTGGSLRTPEDFERIVLKLMNVLGRERTENMHVHFSKIMYGPRGEIRHLTGADTVYGPEFAPFAEVICKYDLSPRVLSESAGTQAEDALDMKKTYERTAEKYRFTNK